MQLTWLDSNSWLFQIAHKNILLDPWLVGNLVFAQQDWLFKGEKQRKYTLPDPIDLILLSQGLEDHAHPPTLKQLDRTIPVVASPNGAKVAQDLGYTQVTPLEHGASYTLEDAVKIQAFPGAPIGPTLVENGYLLTDLTSQNTLYYEPHGYHSPTLKEVAPVDVVITPVTNLTLLQLFPILKGQDSTLQVCQWLNPQVILPTAGAAEIEYEGVLTALIREVGTIEAFCAMLNQNNLKTQVITPSPAEAIDLNLQPSRNTTVYDN